MPQTPQTQQTLLLGIGNPLRGDDGVGSRVLELLAARAKKATKGSGVRLVVAQGLLPELAMEIAQAPRVVFVDADVRVRYVTLERLALEDARAAGHGWSPESLMVIARGLGFSGDAWVCRIPVLAFGHGEGLTEGAERAAEEAATMISGTLLEEARPT